VKHARNVGIDSARSNVLANPASDTAQGDCSMNVPSKQQVDFIHRGFANLRPWERECRYRGNDLPMWPFIAAAHDEPR
jgi:hypothetical protein